MTVSDVSAAFKAAMVTAATTAINDTSVLVCYGHPGTVQPPDIVSVGQITAQQDMATLSNAKRTRDLVLTAEVVVSVFRAGGPEQEQVAGDRAYALLDLVEEYLRTTDTQLATSNGGTPLVWWCFCTSHDSDGSTDPEVLANGRLIEIRATFTARARITS